MNVWSSYVIPPARILGLWARATLLGLCGVRDQSRASCMLGTETHYQPRYIPNYSPFTLSIFVWFRKKNALTEVGLVLAYFCRDYRPVPLYPASHMMY